MYILKYILYFFSGNKQIKQKIIKITSLRYFTKIIATILSDFVFWQSEISLYCVPLQQQTLNQIQKFSNKVYTYFYFYQQKCIFLTTIFYRQIAHTFLQLFSRSAEVAQKCRARKCKIIRTSNFQQNAHIKSRHSNMIFFLFSHNLLFFIYLMPVSRQQAGIKGINNKKIFLLLKLPSTTHPIEKYHFVIQNSVI
eukprot:TRINITY_DN4013_c0_g1_i2.p1 TRINITY_DN4013_c0_g1~~TRINITY_DN4013_c0_g1_i2.p1  ORF type:complete len:195 (+),score=-18.04 TRINITY_DN4013_c0_g1_i2:1608-2192(+)